MDEGGVVVVPQNWKTGVSTSAGIRGGLMGHRERWRALSSLPVGSLSSKCAVVGGTSLSEL
ncbi:hypothetical protein GCM10007147_26760 [Nocardiopsis kunsanensis]|uniref:Uncharacterized protein n=1 Tax=Nocardiopsis kunsanensis TaxID=141693 RepID=A0A918XDZ3_9ACTN|nr:hypothetical protein GCM10007147_26760 [Nocardiopsis kunsanensis]